MSSKNIFIDTRAIKNGLMKARWPGRLGLVEKKPFIVVDGAQDVGSAARLKKALQDTFKYKKLFLIFGAMKDKDIDGILKVLGGMADFLVATKTKSKRACPPKLIREKALGCKKGIDVITARSADEAIKKCREKTGEEDLILVTGYLYLVADDLKAIGKNY